MIDVSAAATWVVQQLREAFPFGAALCHLIFDRDSTFSEDVVSTMKSFGIQPTRTAFSSPWQNGVAERWIGSVRRELLDHVLLFSEDHLRRLVAEFVRFYNEARPHQALAQHQPIPRPGEPEGRITGIPVLGRKREKPVHVSVGRLLITTAHRHVATPDGNRSYLWYRTMTYSKGAPGEVMLDGTVSDPVACPSHAPLSVRGTPFPSSISAARAVAISCTRGALVARRCQ